MDGAQSEDEQTGVVSPQLLTHWMPGDSQISASVSRLTTVDIRWARRVVLSRWWEIDVECGYRRLWADMSNGTSVTAGSFSVFDDFQVSEVSSHGLRVGVAGRRTLLGPLAAELEAGYTLHVARDVYQRHYHLGSPATTETVDEGSSTEVRGGLDFAFRAHLAFKDRAALVAEYSWRHMGSYHAGELFQAGFTLSLIIGASR